MRQNGTDKNKMFIRDGNTVINDTFIAYIDMCYDTGCVTHTIKLYSTSILSKIR